MDDRLVIGIKQIGNVVFGRVLEQPGRLRNEYELANIQSNSVITSVWSIERPELSQETLFIRGSDSRHDDDWFAYAFKSTETAQRAVEDIRRLVDRINSDPIQQANADTLGLEIIGDK